jgi:hypothetical protein
MNIDWRVVFEDYPSAGRVKKFSVLPGTIPWGMDQDTNLWATLEWLYRDGKADDVRFVEEPVLNPVKDGWFRSECEEGLFLHACYPKDIFQFRRRYESLHSCIREMKNDTDGENMLTMMQTNCDNARKQLWAGWNCLGSDGSRRPRDEGLAGLLEDEYSKKELREIIPYSQWVSKWTNKCNRCCVDLPKALQMWVKLQHSDLADLPF